MTERRVRRGPHGAGATIARGVPPVRTAEDDLLTALLDALALRRGLLGDAVYQHVRRSDLAIVQGIPGVPDILGVVNRTLIAWEVKSETGHPTTEQAWWLSMLGNIEHVDARIVRPDDLDAIVRELMEGRLLGRPRLGRP